MLFGRNYQVSKDSLGESHEEMGKGGYGLEEHLTPDSSSAMCWLRVPEQIIYMSLSFLI